MTPELRAIEERCRFTFVHLGALIGITTDRELVNEARAAGCQFRPYERSRGGVTEWEIFLLPPSVVIEEVAS